MKVLIIGGTGFISGQIADKAAAAGHDVVLFNRGLRNPHSPHDTIAGDLKNLQAFKADLLAAKPDVVVHCMALTEKHAKDLVDVFQGSGAHVIALSSADCYASFERLNNGEPVGSQPVRETDATRKTQFYYRAHGGGDYDKNLMTAALMDAHKAGKVEATVFRVPMVYGPGDFQYANRHGDIIKHIVDGQKDIVMGANEQSALFTYGYVENVAAAVVHSFGHAKTKGEIYNLGEDSVRTRREWAELYADNAGHTFNFRILPPAVTGGGTVPHNFIMDVSKFHRDTGFTDPVSLQESVKRTHDWAVKHPDALKKVNVDYKAASDLADRYDAHMKAFNAKPNPAGPAP